MWVSFTFNNSFSTISLQSCLVSRHEVGCSEPTIIPGRSTSRSRSAMISRDNPTCTRSFCIPNYTSRLLKRVTRIPVLCSPFFIVDAVGGVERAPFALAFPALPCLRTHVGPGYTSATAAARFRMRTRLSTAQAKVKIHATLPTPRCRTLRSPATVFSQPKHSSMRFRLR